MSDLDRLASPIWGDITKENETFSPTGIVEIPL
jgi:hypothetical protein